MRLVDADTLRKEVEKDRDASDMPKMWYQGIEYAINHIIHAPTVDAVPVVRCKDCKWWNGKKETCIEIGGLWRASDFCSWGEMDEAAT